MFRALQAASVTLQGVLEKSFNADPDLAKIFAPTGSAVVSLGTPDEMDIATEIGLSLWLYRLVRDEQTLNRPPLRPSPDLIRRQPLPVRLHYLMTPIITGKGLAVPETEQIILGRVLQTFLDMPLISGPDLSGPFEGSGVELAVRLETLPLEEITRVWDSLERSYRLCLSYEVGVVAIQSLREDAAAPHVKVVLPEIGVASLVGAP